jgi:putative hydrolase of the HAD superfamily
MIKAIVFDCFGVLAEDGWLPFKRQYIGEDRALADAVADLGKQNEYGLLSNHEYFHAASELIGVDEQLLRGAVGKRVPNESLFDFISKELKPMYKIGLLSNANFDVLHNLFNEQQAAVFDASVLSYETQLVKPDPKMFALIAQKLQVETSDCLFIDDVERYAEDAEALGMQSVVYKNLNQAIQDIKNKLISTI